MYFSFKGDNLRCERLWNADVSVHWPGQWLLSAAHNTVEFFLLSFSFFFLSFFFFCCC